MYVCVYIIIVYMLHIHNIYTHTHTHMYTHTYTHTCAHTTQHTYAHTYTIHMHTHIAPPKVFASPDPYTLLTENKENYTLSVTFENRGEPSNVLWLKDGDQIPDESATSLTQTTIGSVDVTTVRTFPLLSRADSGVYRVEVVNLSPGVLENQSRADAVFQVEVKGMCVCMYVRMYVLIVMFAYYAVHSVKCMCCVCMCMCVRACMCL